MKTRNLIFSWGAKKWGEATSSIQTVKVLPEFESIVITYSHEGEGFGWFDAGKLERVISYSTSSSTPARPFHPIREESR